MNTLASITSVSAVGTVMFILSVAYNVYQAISNQNALRSQKKLNESQNQDTALDILQKREAVLTSKINEQEKELSNCKTTIEGRDKRLADAEKHSADLKALLENRSPQLEEYIKASTAWQSQINDLLTFVRDYITKNDNRMEDLTRTLTSHTEALSKLLQTKGD